MSLYAFCRELRFTELPAATRQRLLNCLLDILGVAAGARHTPASRAMREYVRAHYGRDDIVAVSDRVEHPAGGDEMLRARVLFDGSLVHPLGAAWAGGFIIDSLDAHEGHFISKGHAGATVVPAILALVDATREGGRTLSGEELLGLLAVGYETALRAGGALMDSACDYHASGAFSGIGVVCAGARLLDLDETTFRHALGIAEYFAPRCPMMRLIDHPSMLRDAHGAGAHAGVNALLLARAGVTGAPATLVESQALEAHWRTLGERWEIDAQYFKPWPVCRWAQPALTAVTRLLGVGTALPPEAVCRVHVETFHESMRLQGHAPSNSDEAQYALAFPLAALIARGRLGIAELDGEALVAPDILAISRRIEIVEAPDLSARFPAEILSRVTLELSDGQRLVSPITAALGDPETPLDDAALRAKFRHFAALDLDATHCEAIEAAVAGLAQAADCQAFLDLILTRRVPAMKALDSAT